MKINLAGNTIFCGDNLEWLKHIPDQSIDLCYIDPPFFSNANYEIVWGNGYEVRSFGDRFSGGISHYIEWMKPRIEEIHRVLKSTGTILLHCDWHASHRLRCLLDDIFGEKNFRDEIVWYYSNKYTGNKRDGFVKQHDLIFRYSKGKKFTFNILRTKAKHAGRTTSTTERTRINGKSVKVMKRKNDGSLIHQTVGDEKNQGSIIEIDFINSQAKERLSYPTQKPEALLEKMIGCASVEGDIVLDCFGGGGTSSKVAYKMNRRFVTGDVSPVAVKIMAERLARECPDALFELKGLYGTEEEFKSVDGHRFAELICELTGWKPNDKKSGDKGIDAWDGAGNPVQIKNHKTSAGRPDIQSFVGAIQGDKKKAGQFVAWDFSRDAKEFVANLKQNKIGVEIQLTYCAEIFGPLLIMAEKRKEIETHYQERFPEKWKGEVTAVSKDESLKQKVAAAVKKTTAKKKKKS